MGSEEKVPPPLKRAQWVSGYLEALGLFGGVTEAGVVVIWWPVRPDLGWVGMGDVDGAMSRSEERSVLRAWALAERARAGKAEAALVAEVRGRRLDKIRELHAWVCATRECPGVVRRRKPPDRCPECKRAGYVTSAFDDDPRVAAHDEAALRASEVPA